MRLSCSGAMGEEMWTEGRNRSSGGAVGVTRRSIEGNFFVWGIALRKVAVFMTVSANFADAVLTIE